MLMATSSSFFKGFFSLKKKRKKVCDVASHIGNHPQEELTKFGYRSKRKVENYKNPVIFLATCWNLLSIYDNFRKKIKIPQQISHVFFFHKMHMYESYRIIYLYYIFFPSGKNNSQKKKFIF